jgi:thymidylate synthase ThyX
MNRQVTILRGDPTIAVLFEMTASDEGEGLNEMLDWVQAHRPECVPDSIEGDAELTWAALFPHNLHEPPGNPGAIPGAASRLLSWNELIPEIAGRKCYDSFGLKAGKKSNREYIEHTQSGEVKHASILYHAKMTFFFAGISRRVSHEIIRNYVGSDRDEEGSPSQESTRFTHHYGFFIEPPRYANRHGLSMHFEQSMQRAYNDYSSAVDLDVAEFTKENGKRPTSIDRKRIYEASSSFLPHQAETSFIWTTNPMAIAKFCHERDNEAADLEIQRFARKWKKICVARWPNLFPQNFMKVTT